MQNAAAYVEISPWPLSLAEPGCSRASPPEVSPWGRIFALGDGEFPREALANFADPIQAIANRRGQQPRGD